MAAADKYREVYSQRMLEADPVALQGRFGFDPELFSACARRFADSILTAHELAPARWGLTDRDSHVRLNVGRVEALAVEPTWLRVVLDGRLVSPELELWLTKSRCEVGRSRGYASTPNARFTDIPLDSNQGLAAALERTRPAHEAHLHEAAKTPVHPMAYRGHHPGLVRALAIAAGVDLPQPSYVRLGSLLHGSRPSSAEAELEAVEEGGLRDIALKKAKREAELRAECLDHWGLFCQACGRSLADEYGEEATELLHVHHLTSFRAHPGPRRTDPTKDLRPVCPNCHAVIHLGGGTRTIEEVREMRRKAAEAKGRLG